MIRPNQTLTQVFPYTELASFTMTVAGVGVNRTYRLNDLFDPDQTGVGTTAFGLSSWANIFTRFLVEEVQVAVEFVNQTAFSDLVVGVILNAEITSLPSNSSAWVSAPGLGSRALGPVSGSRDVVRFVRTIKPWQWLGVSKRMYYDDPSFYCTNLSSPARVLYMQPWLTSLSTVGSANFVVKMAYRVKMFKPVIQTA
jgi:hypothetical protein